MGYRKEECAVANRIYDHLTNPPFNLLLADDDVDYMIDSFKAIVERLKREESEIVG